MTIGANLRLRTAVTAALAAATVLLASACGGGDPLDQGGGDSGGGSKGSITLSGQNFTEMQIMASMYKQLLEAAGYDVQEKLVSTRPIYMKQLSSGDVQVVPEYLSGIGDYLNIEQNGPNAKPITSNSADESLDAITPLAKKAGVTLLKPSQATDQNAYAVTKEFAEKKDISTLSEFGKLDMPVKLAAAKDCKNREDCAKGLKSVYGIDITEVVPLGFGSPKGKDALKSGEVQLAQVATTDGALDSEGLVILEDDKGLQPAQNLVPAVNTAFLKKHPDVAETLNPLSAELTTDDLAALNVKVDRDREKPEDVAKEYLTDHGLL